MKVLSWAVVCLFITFHAFPQTGVNGKITDKRTGEPIAYANIAILNSSLGTNADREGQFSLILSKGTYRFQISAVGYATQVQQVVATDEALALNISLAANTQTLSEVVVTANKREEDIVQVGTSITSISARKIEDTRTWALNDLTALVPNYTHQTLGVPFQQVQSIRGIQVFSENPAVATYIDGVNNLDILANGFALTDVERIEVLRGPQGTLFGRNAMGGLVNIITKRPTNQTHGFVEASVGNLGLQRYAAGFKTPLIKNKLFFGLNGLYQTQDGYWKNDTTGTTAVDGSVNGRTVGGEENLYGNVYLKWLASPQLELTLNVKGQKDRSDNTGFFVSQADRDVALANPDVINLSRIGAHERDIVNSSLVAKYYTDELTLTSITAYQTIGLSFRDIDFPGFFHSFYNNEIGENLPPQRVWSQELRINSKEDSRLQYTVGAYGFSQRGFEPSTNLAFESPSFPDTYFIFRNRSNNVGVAGFGELSYQLTNKLKATVGMRYDYEDRESTFNGFGDAIFSGGIVTNIRPDTTVSGDYAAISPKVVLSYAPHARSNVYASYTRGFRAGGINSQRQSSNVPLSFDPEYSDNYEIGYKSLVADNKLSFAITTFWIRWQDLQFFNPLAPQVFGTTNVGDARSRGVELELTAIPLKGLQMDVSLGVNDTEYRDFKLVRTNFITLEEFTTPIGGNSLSNAPSHTIFIAAQYEFAINKKLKALVRGEMRNIGNYYTDIQNQIEQPTYTILNTRVGFSYSQYGLFFWAQNLNDERYLAFGNPDSSLGRRVRTAAPRLIGATLSARF